MILKQKKDELKQSVNKSEWTDEDRKNNKKSITWSTLNLVGVIILVVIVPCLPRILSTDTGVILWSIIIGGALALSLFGSINKAIKFTKENVVGLWAKVYCFLVLGVLIAGVIIDMFIMWFIFK